MQLLKYFKPSTHSLCLCTCFRMHLCANAYMGMNVRAILCACMHGCACMCENAGVSENMPGCDSGRVWVCVYECTCKSAITRASLRMSVRACESAGVHASLRECVHARILACEDVCTRAYAHVSVHACNVYVCCLCTSQGCIVGSRGVWPVFELLVRACACVSLIECACVHVCNCIYVRVGVRERLQGFMHVSLGENYV